jgi:hypothetical protein
VVAVVNPTQAATVITPAAQAAIQIKAGDVAQPTVLAIFTTAAPLLTDLDKYAVQNYQFTTSGGDFNTPVLVGLCANAPDDIIPRLRVAHNVPDPNPTGIEILPTAAPGPLGLQCGSESFLRVGLGHDSTNFALRGLQQLGRDIFHLVSPAPLSATSLGGTGVAGKTKKLSTFGVVDPVSIKFQSSGYSYLTLFCDDGCDDPPTGWELPSFNDGSWLVGQAAFGNTSEACPDLTPSIHTSWPGADDNAPSILIRKHFKAELGTSSVSIQLAIDNDAQVFVNGHNITGSASAPEDEGGFATHEGCAELNNSAFVFTAPAAFLNLGGDNVIAIQGVDRGVMSYLDQQTTLVVPIAP